jgi:hypothetical protein
MEKFGLNEADAADTMDRVVAEINEYEARAGADAAAAGRDIRRKAVAQAAGVEAAKKRYRAAQTIIRTNQAMELIITAVRAGVDPAKALDGFIVGRGRGFGAFKSLAAHVETVRGEVKKETWARLRRIEGMSKRLRKDTEFNDMVRREMESLGSTGDAMARQVGEALQNGYIAAAKRFNLAGGDISIRAAYDGWHTHSRSAMHRAAQVIQQNRSLRVRNLLRSVKGAAEDANKTSWVNYTISRIDPEKSFYKGITANDTLKALEQVWEDTVRGPDVAGAVQYSTGIAQKYAQSRTLIFKPGKWAEYRKLFGEKPFNNVVDDFFSQMDMMGRDIAIMETIGPGDPRATVNAIMGQVHDMVKSDAIPVENVTRSAQAINDMMRQGSYASKGMDEVLGVTLSTENRFWAQAMSNFRAWQTISKLGNFFASIPDLYTFANLYSRTSDSRLSGPLRKSSGWLARKTRTPDGIMPCALRG